MSDCPSEDELLSFVDADLPPESLKRIEEHLELCSQCTKKTLALTRLVEDVAAPVSGPPLDVVAHVASVMGRLDQPVQRGVRRSLWVWASGLSLAAAALLAFTELRHDHRAEGLVARGGPGSAALSRNIGVQLYAEQQALAALPNGGKISRRTGLTAGLRNLGTEPAYLLLFAIDSAQEVHWIAPEYTSLGSSPEAVSIQPSLDERLLPSSAVFDDLAPGPLRVVALISPTPLHVAQIEALPAHELQAEALLRSFPRAEIRQFLLSVSTP